MLTSLLAKFKTLVEKAYWKLPTWSVLVCRKFDVKTSSVKHVFIRKRTKNDNDRKENVDRRTRATSARTESLVAFSIEP